MKIEKKLGMLAALVLGASLFGGTGCSSDDETEEEKVLDVSTCEGLCAASEKAECGSESDTKCIDDCNGLDQLCGDESAAYLACGEGKTEVTCIADAVSVGFIAGCEPEGLALRACAGGGMMPGDGGAGGGGGASGTP